MRSISLQFRILCFGYSLLVLQLNEQEPDLAQALAVKSDLEECTGASTSESGSFKFLQYSRKYE